MTASISILAALMLAGSPSLEGNRLTNWGTVFVPDDSKTHEIHEELRDCIVHVSSFSQIEPEKLKVQVQRCDDAYWDAINLKDNPPTFYGLTGQTKDWDIYGDFVSCVNSISSPMWDFPEEYTGGQFRKVVGRCIKLFPR